MPNYLIYSKQNGTAFCQKCKTEFSSKMLSSKRIGSEVKCPICGADGKVKNEKYTAVFWEYGTGIIPCKTSAGLMLRYFNVTRKYEKGWREFKTTYCEMLRETFFDNGEFVTEDRKNSEDKWRYCKLTYGQYRISWYTHKPLGTHAWISSENVKVYTRNLTKYTKGTPVERVNFNQIFSRIKLKDRYGAWSIFHDAYNGYAIFFEYIFKIKIGNLAYELVQYNPYQSINPNEKSVIDMLTLTKENYRELLKLGNKATMADLNRLQKYTQFKLTNDRDKEVFDKYLADDTSHAYDLMKILPITLNKFGKWADTQKFDLRTYIDYLKMCKELELDMKNSFVSMPKELKSAHDMVTDMYNEMKFDMKLKRYADDANTYSGSYSKIVPIKEKKYSFDKGNMKIVVPKTTKDIGHEGYKLRHCVAQYMGDIVKDKKTILFIRNINELDTPFFTMEIIGNKITQCKGYRNCPRPAEVESFLKDFAKNKKLKIAKDEHFAAVI